MASHSINWFLGYNDEGRLFALAAAKQNQKWHSWAQCAIVVDHTLSDYYDLMLLLMSYCRGESWQKAFRLPLKSILMFIYNYLHRRDLIEAHNKCGELFWSLIITNLRMRILCERAGSVHARDGLGSLPQKTLPQMLKLITYYLFNTESFPLRHRYSSLQRCRMKCREEQSVRNGRVRTFVHFARRYDI